MRRPQFWYISQVATLLVGGTMAMKGQISAQQLTSFVMVRACFLSCSQKTLMQDIHCAHGRLR